MHVGVCAHTRYKARLPFILAFNKTDVVSHDFAVRWMTDFSELQDAIDESSTYMASLSRSMGLVLQEFYGALTAVGVSAHTGAGMDEFFTAVQAATTEYHEEYVPLLNRMQEEKKAKERAQADETLAKLKADRQAAGEVVIDAGRKDIARTTEDDDLPTGPDIGPDDTDLIDPRA